MELGGSILCGLYKHHQTSLILNAWRGVRGASMEVRRSNHRWFIRIDKNVTISLNKADICSIYIESSYPYASPPANTVSARRSTSSSEG